MNSTLAILGAGAKAVAPVLDIDPQSGLRELWS